MLNKLGGQQIRHTIVWTIQSVVSGQVGRWCYSTSARTEGQLIRASQKNTENKAAERVWFAVNSLSKSTNNFVRRCTPA